MPDLDVTMFKAPICDCHGTLTDWEHGIATVLAPWAREQGLEMGDEELPSVWINRRHDRSGSGATREPSGEWSYDLEPLSVGALADAVDRAFTGES